MNVLDRIKKSRDVDFYVLIKGVQMYARAVSGRDMQYIAHPATWLNQGRWDDDPVALNGKASGFVHVSHQGEIERTRQFIERKRAARPSEDELDAQFQRLGLSHLRLKRREATE